MKFQLKIGLKNQMFDISTEVASGHQNHKLLI